MAHGRRRAARRAARHARRPGPVRRRARFGLHRRRAQASFREVGEELGVTAEAARRLVKRAVAGLRDDAERIVAV